MSHSSVVHVLVKASGKNARSTFLPRRAERVTGWPEVDARVKSGAGAPTGGADFDMSSVAECGANVVAVKRNDTALRITSWPSLSAIPSAAPELETATRSV